MPAIEQRDRERLVTMLRDLVRIDTTNPPGNEIAAVQYLAPLLERAGVEMRILESAPGRASLIARVRGNTDEKPLMLMGHLDVVAATEAGWMHPPFEAVIDDGYLWGRGSTDNKQMVTISAAILMALAEQHTPLQRTVLLAATADEEHGGTWGMGWLAEHDSEVRNAACAINEGGGSALQVGDRLFYTCQTAEKGICRTEWTARAAGGHAASPREDISTLKLARALSRLGDGHLAGRVTETMRQALLGIAGAFSPGRSARVEELLAAGSVELALAEAGLGKEEIARTRALFYNTASVTVLSAGDTRSVNVLPSVATAHLDGRILPGETQETFCARLQTLAGPEVNVELYDGQYSPGLESAPDAPIVETIRQVIGEQCPGAGVIPWMCAGSTDAKHLIPRGVPVYGFVPSKPVPDHALVGGAHAVNERIWLENLYFGYSVLYDVVTRFCVAG